MATTKQTGDYGETLACEFLKKQGYKILERNFLIRGGEIDIVAEDKDDLVFVEVKTRYTHEFGPPAESVTPFKIRFLIRASEFYLLKHKKVDIAYRIDVVTVDFAKSREKPEIELIRNITG
jgi:putative endonuclease